MIRDTENLRTELEGEDYFFVIDCESEENEIEPEEFEPDYTPEELAAAQTLADAIDMKYFGAKRTTIIQPSEARLEALVAAGHSLREETAAINADARRVREIRLELVAELAELDVKEAA